MKKLLLPLLCLYGAEAFGSSFSDLGLNQTVTAISGNGNVVIGYLPGQNVYGNGIFSYRWTGGTTTVITQAGVTNTADGISTNGGTVVGVIHGVSEDTMYKVTSGTTTQSAFNDTYGGSVAGISGNGQRIVGTDNYSNTSLAFVQEGNVKTNLGDLAGGYVNSTALGISSDGNVVVGQSYSTSGQEAFRWTQSGGMIGLGDLAGGAFGSTANAVDGDGTRIVGVGTSGLGSEAFLWTAANGMVGLGDLAGGGFNSAALSISGDGTTIVGYGTSADGKRATVWDSVNGMRDLASLATGLGMDLTGWILFGAKDVSDDGLVIAGDGQYLGQNHGWVLDFRGMGYTSISQIQSQVPLPATVWLFGTSLVGLSLARRRRARATLE